MTATNETLMMVELHQGYGNGFAVVKYRDGKPVIQPGYKGEYATIPAGIVLQDAGVRVAGAPIKRIVGPVDGADAGRIRIKRFVKNWSDGRFADQATDEEVTAIAAMMDDPNGHASRTLKAVDALEAKYAA
jgi:hypothetical protein